MAGAEDGECIQITSNDQLIKIIEVMKVTPHDAQFAQTLPTFSYLTELLSSDDHSEENDYFKRVHKGVKKDHIRIVKSLLSFNPCDRLSIDDILDMSMFDGVR